MDCKDLMVGDWVKVEEPTETVKARVLGVYKDGVINYEVFYSCVRATGQIHIDYVSPIELTEDILVKNGFDHQMPYNDYAFGEISLYEGGNGYIVNGFVGLGGLSVHIDYVHTLQHLLRLVGVQKEIEL